MIQTSHHIYSNNIQIWIAINLVKCYTKKKKKKGTIYYHSPRGLQVICAT
jgi:hypothetical protein